MRQKDKTKPKTSKQKEAPPDKLSARIEELIAELQKIEKLRERQIVAIANVLPQDTDDLRVVLQKRYSSLSKEEIDLILQSVKKIS